MPIEISKSFVTLEEPLDWFVIVQPHVLLNIEIGLIIWFII